jgi:hypothetical protein
MFTMPALQPSLEQNCHGPEEQVPDGHSLIMGKSVSFRRAQYGRESGVHVTAYTAKNFDAQLRFHFVTLRTESRVLVSGEIQEPRRSVEKDYFA